MSLSYIQYIKTYTHTSIIIRIYIYIFTYNLIIYIYALHIISSNCAAGFPHFHLCWRPGWPIR